MIRAGRVLLLAVGPLLLALAALCGRWAESAAGQPAILDRLLSPFVPPGGALLLILPATFLALRFLSPMSERMPRRAFVAVLAASAASLTPVVAGVTSWAAYLALGTAGVVALAAGAEPWGGKLALAAAGRAAQLIARPRWPHFLAAVGALHLALTLAFSSLFFGGVPHVQDSVAQLFQAKILAGGAIFVPAPPVPEAFDYSHLIVLSGRWFSLYHLAHPFLISLALRLGAPQLANPVIGVVGLLGLACLARSVAGDRVARVAALLALVSPWWLLMHAELMNHVTAGAALTWALFLFVKVGRGARAGWALVAGLLFGVAFLVRPYTPLLVGGALAAFAAARAVKGEKRWLLACCCIGLAAVPGVLLQLWSNALTTGDPWLDPYVVKLGPGILPGFHQPSWGPPHTPRLGLRNVLADLNALNRWVLGLPIPLVILLAGLAGGRRGRPVRDERSSRHELPGEPEPPGWLYAVPCALLAGHFAFWYVDFCFGPRYLFEALPCLLILTALSLQELWERVPARLALAGGLALLAATIVVWPGIAANYAHAFYGVDDRVAARIADDAPADALVFVTADYGGFVWRNDPWLRHGPIFVRESGAGVRQRLLRAFPGRRPFRQVGGLLIPVP
jgi:hypothetical protein